MQNRVKGLLALLGFYLLVIVGGELALRGVFALRDWVRSDPAVVQGDPRGRLPAYEGADFDPVKVWEEVQIGSDLWLAYQPYTVWTRKTIEGQYVNVDERGYRVTVNNSAAPDALVIWMIGGSTTWGMGVPDAETLPSQLARQFGELGIDVRVRNLAETGFVSTQEVVRLMRELQVSEPPDLFIAYDSLNEGVGAYERSEVINPHYMMERISGLFEGTASDSRLGTLESLEAVAKTTGYYRLVEFLRARLLPDPGLAAGSEQVNTSDIPTVAARSADTLIENYRLMSVLGEEFGFPCFFFFQPQPGVSAKPLHPSEEQILVEVNADPSQEWVLRFSIEQQRAFRKRLAAGISLERVFDISGLFDDVEEPVFLDWAHLSHSGNELVTTRISSIIRQAVCSAQAGTFSHRVTEALAPGCPGEDAIR